MKRWIAILLAAALAGCLLCGCGAEQSAYTDDPAGTTTTTAASKELSEYLPSAEEYAQRILALHPETADYLLAAEENGDLIYTDTGSTTDYSEVLLTTAAGAFMLSKTNNGKQYLVHYDPATKVLLAKTSEGMGLMSDVVRDAAAYIQDYPAAMTAGDINEAFILEGKTNTDYAKPFTTYETTKDGINYQITSTETYYMVRLEFTPSYRYTPS